MKAYILPPQSWQADVELMKRAAILGTYQRIPDGCEIMEIRNDRVWRDGDLVVRADLDSV